jgi:hypothetical protein
MERMKTALSAFPFYTTGGIMLALRSFPLVTTAKYLEGDRLFVK